MKSVRIGASVGFWGDIFTSAVDVARYGDVKYICGDSLAELTMAILQKARNKNPKDGYTKDVFPLMTSLLPICKEKGIKIISNCGGINPQGAMEAVKGIAKKLGLSDLKIAVVEGDNILDRLKEFADKGYLGNLGAETGSLGDKILFANVYLGGREIAKALATGADIVITGRTTDSAQFLGPAMYELGWQEDDWDKIAQGIVLGHLMECSGQATGGNFSGEWWKVDKLGNLGYPVSEIYENGEFIFSKPQNTGGMVCVDTVKEQLLYEIHDPTCYLTPDVIVDFSSVKLENIGTDQVKVTGATGKPKPPTLKATLGYTAGFVGEGSITYSWPDALPKARKAEEIIRGRIDMQGINYEEIHSEYIGLNSIHGPLAPEPECEINEVMLRVAVRTSTKDEAAKIGREFPALALNGPPHASGLGGMHSIRELIGQKTALIPREEIEPLVKISVEEV